MNRRDFFRTTALATAGALVSAEAVHDFMAWQNRRIFALGSWERPWQPCWDWTCHGEVISVGGKGPGKDGLWRFDGERTLWVPYTPKQKQSPARYVGGYYSMVSYPINSEL